MQILDQLVATPPPGASAGNGGGPDQPDSAPGFAETYFGLNTGARRSATTAGPGGSEGPPSETQPDKADRTSADMPDAPMPLALAFRQVEPAGPDPENTGATGVPFKIPGEPSAPLAERASETTMGRRTGGDGPEDFDDALDDTRDKAVARLLGLRNVSAAVPAGPTDDPETFADKPWPTGAAEGKDAANGVLQGSYVIADMSTQPVGNSISARPKIPFSTVSDGPDPAKGGIIRANSEGIASQGTAMRKPGNIDRILPPTASGQPAGNVSRSDKTPSGPNPNRAFQGEQGLKFQAAASEISSGKIGGSGDLSSADPASTSESSASSRPIQITTPLSGAGAVPVTTPTIANPADLPLSDAPDAAPLASEGRLQTDMRVIFRAGAGPGQTSASVAQSVSGQITATLSGATDGKIEIHLRPAELGRVTIQLNPTENGLAALVSAERSEVAELLRRNGEIFRRDLVELGFSEVSLDFEASENGRHAEPPYFLQPDGSRHGEVSTQEAALTVAAVATATHGGLDIRI